MNTLEFRDGALWILDQSRLPRESIVFACRTEDQVAEAICSLRVRGAPAIGLTAAYGTVLIARAVLDQHLPAHRFVEELSHAMNRLRQTRPTAVNLFWALNRMKQVMAAHQGASQETIVEALHHEADVMLREDAAINQSMGYFGADLIPDGAHVLTHCNSGALAAGAFGTALGAIRAAWDQGKQIHVWVDETRPLLQGARLTTWELQQLGIPFTLITDSMAAHFMARGKIHMAMVGADRIVANGDAANKIGTYGAAVLAGAHGLPFYFVAPTSTVDLSTPSGDRITIEERNPEEVHGFGGVRWTPDDIDVANPAFDVTPARLITAIVTERGVVRPPFDDGLAEIAAQPARPVENTGTALAGAESV